MSVRKKVVWISAVIIIAAIIIVLCVNFLSQEKTAEFDGTLVQKSNICHVHSSV